MVEDAAHEPGEVVHVDRNSLGHLMLIELEYSLEQGLLVSEVGVQPLLARVGRRGDAIDPCPRQTECGEFRPSSVKNS